MKPKFTDEEFKNSKSNDKLKCECYNCKNDFFIQKKHIKGFLNKTVINVIKFCSRKCDYESRIKKVEFNCSECSEIILRTPRQIENDSKSGNVFCNSSCAAKYNNQHKKTGTRRSKLEFWIEEQLKRRYKFEIIFNGKESINSELDIYIPSLKLAFELNGIFHYEPIYGDKKLESIKNNDERKFQACLEKGIEFCIIDTSGSIKFKPERDKKYLDIIENIINIKMNMNDIEKLAMEHFPGIDGLSISMRETWIKRYLNNKKNKEMKTTTQQQPQQQINQTD